MTTRYFDITDVLFYVKKESSISGIQRVSFEVIRRMVQRYGSEKVRVCYWDKGRRDYLAMPSDFVADMEEFDHDVLSTVFFGSKVRLLENTAPSLERYRSHRGKYWFHYAQRLLNAYRGNESHFLRAGATLEEWRSFRAGTSPRDKDYDLGRIPRSSVFGQARPGDQLVVLGGTWAIDGLEQALRRLHRDNGVEITQMVHDLIPIKTPEHIAGDFAPAFYHWLRTLPDYCSAFLANSRNTALDLKEFLVEVGSDHPVHTVPLAQEFVAAAESPPGAIHGPDGPYKRRVERTLLMRREILNLTKVPYVLVVGTVESRKNSWRLAQVWQRLCRDEGLEMPRLVFAGKRGWLNDDFDAMMTATGNLDGWVQFASRPTDAELRHLYENCLFTATVSLYEGWGLPIGESLHFGKTAVVADNSAMPEVGGALVEYCDAGSLESMTAAFRRLIADPAHRQALEAKIAATRLRRWDDVAGDLVELFSDEEDAAAERPRAASA
ncbi:glycosyltransferase [Oceanicola sp. S124]|uniref:glycosyltransferase n=1 Tax=Oceanicola sp. S124 TaxID=1042378 RepID=UPI0002557964|nr:glycosyltransferase [Oceanicola sp. S124]